jgi:hypothetical protein
LKADEGEELNNVELHSKLVGSLFYLTIKRPDICYLVGVISQLKQKSQMIAL